MPDAWTADVVQRFPGGRQASDLVGRWHVALERRRIRRHLHRVDIELSARDTSGLTLEQQSARARNLERLRAYRNRGEFPRNTEVLSRIPHLRDRSGTPCAVAYLMDCDGRATDVDAMAAVDNFVRIPDVRDGRLAAWLASAGLTQAEAARIQPAYDGLPWEPPSTPPNPPVEMQAPDQTLALVILAIGFGLSIAYVFIVWFILRRSYSHGRKPVKVPGRATWWVRRAAIKTAQDIHSD